MHLFYNDGAALYASPFCPIPESPSESDRGNLAIMYKPLLLVLLVQGVCADFEIPVKNNALAKVVALATTTNPGLLACATAEVLLEGCYSALPTTAPALQQAECFCCLSGDFVATIYSSCASYITASARAYTDEYSCP